MNNVYGIVWNAATNTWAVAFETVRGRGKVPVGLTLPGIATVISLGVPFSGIAQAAPAARYLIAENRETILPPGLATSVSFAASSGIPEGPAGALVLANHALSSDDFWRIADVRAAPPETRRVSTLRKRHGKRSSRVMRHTAVGAGVASRERTTGVHRKLATVSNVAKRGGPRYDSAFGAASAPFYQAARRLDTSPAHADDLRTDTGSLLASRMAEHPQQYLSVAATPPERRTDGAMADLVDVSDVAPAADAPVGAPDHGPQSVGGTDSDAVVGTLPRAVPLYSKPWAASGNTNAVPVRMSARSIPPVEGVDVAQEPSAAADSPDSIVHEHDAATHAYVDLADASTDASVSTSTNATPATSATPAAGPSADTGRDVTLDAPSATAQSDKNASTTTGDNAGANAAVVDGTKIEQISFTGNSLFNAGVLLDEMQLSATNWGSWYTKHDVYSQEKLAAGLDRLRQYYLDRGYLESRVESVQTSMMPDGKAASLSIAIHEGERYTLSAIKLAGVSPDLETELAALIELRTGDALSAEKLKASIRAIADRLSGQGYPYAAVTPLSQVDSDRHTVDVTLQIDPGPRVTVRNIDVSGNTITRDEVVRREIRQPANGWYDAKKLAASKTRLEQLGYFSKIDVQTVPVPDSPDQVDVSVKVVENPRAEFNLGVGYSSTDRILGTVSVTKDNLFGTGQSIGASVATAKPYRSFTLKQTDPYFTSGGVSRTTTAYYRVNEPLYYASDSRFTIVTKGVDLHFGIPLSSADEVYAGAAIEHIRLDLDTLSPQNYIDYVAKNGRESNNVPLMVGWSRDTRDSDVLTSHGYLAHVGAEYGTPAGGNQYYKANIDARYYYPVVHDVVLMMRVQGGYGGGIGNRPYPLFKNYYVGGIGSVRGYEANSLSPRDVKTGQPIGGSKMLAGSMELKFPLPSMASEYKPSVFTFVDGGNAWGGQGASIGSNGMRWSYGAGFAWNLPGGSFKISAGLPIIRHAGDKYQKIQLQLETSF